MSASRDDLMTRCREFGLSMSDMQRMSNLSLGHWLETAGGKSLDDTETSDTPQEPAFIGGMREDLDDEDIRELQLDSVNVAGSRTEQDDTAVTSNWPIRARHRDDADEVGDHDVDEEEEEEEETAQCEMDRHQPEDGVRSMRSRGNTSHRVNPSSMSRHSRHSSPPMSDEDEPIRGERRVGRSHQVSQPPVKATVTQLLAPAKQPQRPLVSQPVTLERDPMIPSNEAYDAYLQQTMPAFSAPPALQMYDQLQQKFDKPSTQIMENPVMREFIKSFGPITSTYGYVQAIQQQRLFPQLISPCLDDEERELFQKSNTFVGGNPAMHILDPNQVPAGALENPVYALYKAQEKLVLFLTQLLAGRQSLPKILRPEHHGNVMAKEQLLASLRRVQDQKLFYLSECIQNLSRDVGHPHHGLFAQALSFLQAPGLICPTSSASAAGQRPLPPRTSNPSVGTSAPATATHGSMSSSTESNAAPATMYRPTVVSMPFYTDSASQVHPFHLSQQYQQQRAYSMPYASNSPQQQQQHAFYNTPTMQTRGAFGF